MGTSFNFQKCTDMQAGLIIEAPSLLPSFPFSLRSASPLSMSTILPSPDQEQTIDEEARDVEDRTWCMGAAKGHKI